MHVPFPYQLPHPPKEQLELIVVKEEPVEVESGDKEQDGPSEDSKFINGHLHVPRVSPM